MRAHCISRRPAITDSTAFQNKLDSSEAPGLRLRDLDDKATVVDGVPKWHHTFNRWPTRKPPAHVVRDVGLEGNHNRNTPGKHSILQGLKCNSDFDGLRETIVEPCGRVSIVVVQPDKELCRNLLSLLICNSQMHLRSPQRASFGVAHLPAQLGRTLTLQGSEWAEWLATNISTSAPSGSHALIPRSCEATDSTHSFAHPPSLIISSNTICGELAVVCQISRAT